MNSRQGLTFLGLCIVSLLVWWKAGFAILSLAFSSSEYSHVLLIVPISITLIFLRRSVLPNLIRYDVKAGFPILTLAIAVELWTNRAFSHVASVALFSSMLALVTWWIGAAVLCFGTRVFHAVMFPILFLFWLAPLPEFVLDRIVMALQQTSASLTYFLFISVAVPVGKDGVVLSIPSLSIEVAKECSSIRSSLILVITSMVLAHLFLRSAWRKGLVILVAIPLAVAKNALRIFTLSMLATHVDPAFLTGRLHRQGGVVFFSLSVIVIWLFIRALQEKDVTPERKLASLSATTGQSINQ
jgi:exosortase